MFQLWQQHDQGLTSTPIDGPTRLADRETGPAPLLAPLEGQTDAIAALVVPDVLHRAVAHNGVPLAAGLHRIAHADRLEFAGRTYFLAASAQFGSQLYAPEVHGQDVFCFITKVRLEARDEIVVCPGLPGVECGIIYKREAWEMARQASENFRCPQCGFDPAAGQWQPTVRRRGSLARLFSLADQHKHKG